MKKIFTTLFATAAVFCASAAVPTFEVNPGEGTVLENKDQEVTFTFSESVTVTKIGFASGPLNQRQFAVDSVPQTGKTIKAQILDSYWGKAQDGVISMQVLCMDVLDAKGDTIMNADGYPEQFIVNYTYKEAASGAKFVSVWPAEGEYSAAEMYGTGADFYFTDEVEMTNANATAIVTYTDDENEIYVVNIPADDVWADWNWWTGDYSLSVPMPEVDGLDAEYVVKAVVHLQGIMSNGVAVSVPDVTYTTTTAPQKINKKVNTAGSNLSIIPEKTVGNIYTISGVLIQENADLNNITLPKGIYITNGKKIIVK